MPGDWTPVATAPMTGELLATAQQWLAGSRDEAVPRPAATVLLLRDAVAPAQGVELWLMRRRATMAFAAGMAVFPGGRVDPRDGEVVAAWTGSSPASLADRMGRSPEETAALVGAAVRETYEETGVLLATRADGTSPVLADDVRLALEAHETSLAQVLAGARAELDADHLRPFARWVTPAFEPRRYDTWFFAAVLPAGATAQAVTSESDGAEWWTPAGALAAGERGELALMPPTVRGLADVAELVAAGCDAAGVVDAFGNRPLRTVEPHVVDHDGVLHLEPR